MISRDTRSRHFRDVETGGSERTRLLGKDQAEEFGGRRKHAVLSWLVVPVCGLIVLVATEPYMVYSLYHTQLQQTLGLTAEQAGDVQSFGTIGGLCLAIIPGMVYDIYGFSTCMITGCGLGSFGAGIWYFLLRFGGAPGSPGWLPLAASFLCLGLGTRFYFIAAMCTVLDMFPEKYAPRVSSIMSCCSAMGAVLLPVAWRMWFVPSDEIAGLPEFHPSHPRLTPVAHFHLMLVFAYGATCIAGLCLAPVLQSRQKKPQVPALAAMAKRAVTGPGIALLSITLITLPCVYEYFGSAMAPLGKKALADAGITGAPAHQVQAQMTTRCTLLSFLGRIVVGLGADKLAQIPRLANSAIYAMYFAATLFSFAGFSMLMVGHEGKETNVELWSSGCYALAFSFGGFFALLPGSVRTWFPKDELGTWLGCAFCLIGTSNFICARFAAAADYSATFWKVALLGTAVTGVTFAHLAYVTYLKGMNEAAAAATPAERAVAANAPPPAPESGEAAHRADRNLSRRPGGPLPSIKECSAPQQLMRTPSPPPECTPSAGPAARTPSPPPLAPAARRKSPR